MESQAKPDRQTMVRAEELLQEQLEELGVDITKLAPHEISAGMSCSVYPDGTLAYSWQGKPVLHVEPEEQGDGTVRWRFFTHDEPMQ